MIARRSIPEVSSRPNRKTDATCSDTVQAMARAAATALATCSSLRASVFSRGVRNSAWATNFLSRLAWSQKRACSSPSLLSGEAADRSPRAARMDRSAWASATSASCASPRRGPAALTSRAAMASTSTLSASSQAASVKRVFSVTPQSSRRAVRPR